LDIIQNIKCHFFISLWKIYDKAIRFKKKKRSLFPFPN